MPPRHKPDAPERERARQALALRTQGLSYAEIARRLGYRGSNGWFTRAVAATKVQRVTPHDMRHTCASLAVAAGVNVLALQRMLGHTSAKMTLDTYADLFDDDLDEVAVTLHAQYSPEHVGKTWAHRGDDNAQQTGTPGVAAQTNSEHQCGRRDSNPHALSSTGT